VSYRVEIDNRATRQIRELRPDMQRRIMQALDGLRDDPRPSGCAKLKGQGAAAWRVRVGNHRVLYRVYDSEQTVRVYGVLRRDQAYRG
jgi:mRNA interferase RelE/StbE